MDGDDFSHFGERGMHVMRRKAFRVVVVIAIPILGRHRTGTVFDDLLPLLLGAVVEHLHEADEMLGLAEGLRDDLLDTARKE